MAWKWQPGDVDVGIQISLFDVEMPELPVLV